MKNKDTEKNARVDAPVPEKLSVIEAFLNEQKALDIEAFQLDGAFTDAIVVAGATSRRHAQGLAEGIGRMCQEKGYEFLGMEGYDNAQWILVDCNDIVINIFQEEARGLYRLEELWAQNAGSGGKPGKET